MNICLIGNGLVSLTLARTLVNNKIKVNMYSVGSKKTQNQNRTISISADNWEFLQKEVIKIKNNLAWEINDIEIYNEENRKEKILNFNKSRKKLFLVIKNNYLYETLDKSLKKSNYFKKIKIENKLNFSKYIFKKNFDLIINCDPKNEISKKYFYNKIVKNYESTAYAGIINHSKTQNKKAVQIFTKYGPLAFLPISKHQTSVVFSIKNKSINDPTNISEIELKKLILKNNQKYKISSMTNFENLNLKSKTLRNYYHNNILAFGDMLHQIHPLAGQGFNMTIRDIKVLLNLIRDRKNLGLPIDSSLCENFEGKTKHLNFMFASGNDFIYEFFNYDNFYLNTFRKKMFNLLNKNNYINKLAIKYADQGLIL